MILHENNHSFGGLSHDSTSLKNSHCCRGSPLQKLTKLIQAGGATGYAVNAADGEDSHLLRSTGAPSVPLPSRM